MLFQSLFPVVGYYRERVITIYNNNNKSKTNLAASVLNKRMENTQKVKKNAL